MLVTILDTKSYGKFVLHKYPYEEIHIEQEGFEKLPSNELLESISDTFDYFAIYRKKQLIHTSRDPLPQKAVVEIFAANEKSSQIVLGIDDECVLVSRSAFLAPRSTQVSDFNTAFSDNAVFTQWAEEGESIVNSISLVWRQSSFEKLDQTKHRLSFLLGVLEKREQQARFLTKEVTRIMEEKNSMRRRIKDLLALNTRDSPQPFEQIRVKILAREIQEQAKRTRERIPLFRFLKDYCDSWLRGGCFEVRQDECIWEGTIGGRAIVEEKEKSVAKMQHKTLVMLPPKLAEYLPPILYSQRVKRLYERGFCFSNLSFRKLLEHSPNISSRQLYHTAYFLLRNRLAIDIYPINYPHSYNLFTLRELPGRALAEKFNHRIFPGKNFLEIVENYSKYKVARQEEETLKYLLLKEIIGEVGIYIYRKCEEEEEKLQGTALMLHELLSKYSLSEHDLNHLLAVEPSPFSSKDCSLLNAVTKFVKQHSRHWGFYFVE